MITPYGSYGRCEARHDFVRPSLFLIRSRDCTDMLKEQLSVGVASKTTVVMCFLGFSKSFNSYSVDL